MNDYLGRASELRYKLEQLIKDKQFDQAWHLTFDLSDLYVKHVGAVSRECSPEILAWANCLANSVSEYRAEILSKEGKHLDALLQSIWRAATEHRPIKKYTSKMLGYLKKAKINLSEEELMEIYNRTRSHNDYGTLKSEFKKIT